MEANDDDRIDFWLPYWCPPKRTPINMAAASVLNTIIFTQLKLGYEKNYKGMIWTKGFFVPALSNN